VCVRAMCCILVLLFSADEKIRLFLFGGFHGGL